MAKFITLGIYTAKGLGGFVNNPLTGDLLGGGNNIVLQGGNLTAAQLNYTTLNPPINPGVTNPLAVDLLCNNKNIGVGAVGDKANEIRSITGTFDNSALGVATGTTLTTTGAVTAVGSTYGSLCNIVAGLTVGSGIVNASGTIVNSASGGFVNTGTGGLTNNGSGGVDCQGSGKVKTASGNIESGGRIISNQFIRCDNGNIIAATGRIYAAVGNLEALAGDVDSLVGSIQGQQLKINNPIVNTYGSAIPVPIPDQDMTGISKLALWVYDPSSPTIQFIVETGITDVTQNSTTFLTVNQFSTGGTPLRVVNYRIGAAGIAPPDNTKLAVSVTMTANVPVGQPIRLCLLVIPDV